MAPRNSITLSRILQAGIEIMETNGEEELTLTTLAGKLGIRTPSLYNHIGGIQDVRRLLAVHGLEQLQSELTDAAIGRAGDDAIRAMAQAYISFARNNPGLYEATLYTPGGEDADYSRVAQAIVDLVTQVFKAYQLKQDDSLHMARALRCILHGFASLKHRGGFGLPLDLELSFGEIVETFLAGLHTRYIKN